MKIRIYSCILVLTFLALQYGKLASYWECQMSAETAAAYCECEKLLLDSHQQGTNETAPTAIAKEKTEESYMGAVVINHVTQEQVFHTPSSLYVAWIPGDHTQNIFQPPKA